MHLVDVGTISKLHTNLIHNIQQHFKRRERSKAKQKKKKRNVNIFNLQKV